MGRYAGEEIDYDYSPHEHRFAINGLCWQCGRSREQIQGEARRVLELSEPADEAAAASPVLDALASHQRRDVTEPDGQARAGCSCGWLASTVPNRLDQFFAHQARTIGPIIQQERRSARVEALRAVTQHGLVWAHAELLRETEDDES